MLSSLRGFTKVGKDFGEDKDKKEAFIKNGL